MMIILISFFDDLSVPSPAATETATKSTESYDGLTETESAAPTHGSTNTTYNKQNVEILWDANIIPWSPNNTASQEFHLLNQNQQPSTDFTTNNDSSTHSSVLGWVYNFFFTQFAGGLTAGTDGGLCTSNGTHMIAVTPCCNTHKHHSYHKRDQDQPIETNSTSTLGRAETASSEKLGIIAPPEILRRPTTPTFIPTDSTNVTALHSDIVTKSPTSASF
jgi:hypothetical protein